MIEAKFQLQGVDDIPATLTMTMTLGEWRKLMRQIPTSSYPAWEVAKRIAEMIGHANAHFAKKIEMDPGV